MRSVWGCTPASSAATEITYTARVRRSFIRVTSTPSHPEVGPRGVLRCGSERFDRRLLLLGQLGRHGHLDGDEQVPPTALAVVDPAALHPEDPARAGAGGQAQRHRVALDRRDREPGAERR